MNSVSKHFIQKYEVYACDRNRNHKKLKKFNAGIEPSTK